RHGVADLEGHDRRPLAERPRDRVRPRRLGRDQARRVADPAGRVHLAKAARRRDERLADRDRRDDDVGRYPAGLLGDLVCRLLLEKKKRKNKLSTPITALTQYE